MLNPEYPDLIPRRTQVGQGRTAARAARSPAETGDSAGRATLNHCAMFGPLYGVKHRAIFRLRQPAPEMPGFRRAATRRPAASRLMSTSPVCQTPALSYEREFDQQRRA